MGRHHAFWGLQVFSHQTQMPRVQTMQYIAPPIAEMLPPRMLPLSDLLAIALYGIRSHALADMQKRVGVKNLGKYTTDIPWLLHCLTFQTNSHPASRQLNKKSAEKENSIRLFFIFARKCNFTFSKKCPFGLFS